MTNIFIANLDWEITSEDLAATFSAFGAVHLAHVVFDAKTKQSKGFGYVEMDSAEEAIKAIQALNGFEVNGRKLDVKIASPKANRPKKEDKPKPQQRPFNKQGGGGFGGQKRFNNNQGGGQGGYRSNNQGGGQGGYRSNNAGGGGGYRSNDGNSSGGYRSNDGNSSGGYRSNDGNSTGGYRSNNEGGFRPNNDRYEGNSGNSEGKSDFRSNDRPPRPRKRID